jgi:exopolyphosphatase / guanosine-5'-triphosphate,3'-diphosphate pyrophosphatase
VQSKRSDKAAKVAAIDLGTNTFLCLIAEVGAAANKTLKVIDDASKVVRLGEKVHQNRAFLPQALERAAACLDQFQKMIQIHKVDKVIATATSAARDATNGQELIKLGRDRGIPIHIIEGKKEAELSFDGAVSAIESAANKKILVIDVGGGSTELIFREPGKDIKATSFDVGCVRLTEMFLKNDPVSANEYQALQSYAAKVMNQYGHVSPDLVVAVAGTPTTLACVAQKIDFDEYKVEGYTLTRQKISDLARDLGALPLSERKKVKGLEPLRADVIVTGCALLERGLDLAGRDEMRVSTRGLRYGIALHHEDFQ